MSELRSAKTHSESAGTNKAVVTLVENQHSVARVRGFNLLQDEPRSVAGGMRGLTPTDFFMSSLGTCENVVFVRYAALEDVPVEALETTVTGTWDRRGLYGIAGVDPHFKEITIETRVSTSAPKEKVAEVARRTHSGCPIYATLRKDTLLTFRLFVNGEQQPL
ncbi:MAG TPA: OsmC family protein [Spirochaetia bacterium]|nr:OsmC family protein [Spirochaetia bacterium]